MQQPWRGSAPLESVPQGSEGQARVQCRGARPPDNAAAPSIKNGGQEQPAFRGFEVRDIGAPRLVGARRGGTLRDEVRGDRLGMAAVRRARPAPVLLLAAQALGAHQSGAAALARMRARFPQILDNPRRSIGAPARLVEGGDLRRERRVCVRSGARSRLLPPVIAAGRDVQQATQQTDRMVALHRFDLGIPLSGGSERMPNDFFRTISRSRSRTISVRRRPFSFWASSRVCGAGPPPAPGRGAYSLRHS